MILFEVYFDKEDYPGTAGSMFDDVKELSTSSIIFYLDPLNKALSAIVLIFSIMLFRRSVSRLKTHILLSREKLMLVHTVSFLTCILVYLGSILTANISTENFESIMADLAP